MKGKTPRNRDLAKIHIAKKQLGLDDSTYRAMLRSVAGVESAAKLTAAGRRKVLAHLHRTGFKTKGKPQRYPGRPKGMDRGLKAAQMGKIEALLTVGKKEWTYAHTLARRICKVDRIEFVKERDLYKIITALRMQAIREGWDLSGEVR